MCFVTRETFTSAIVVVDPYSSGIQLVDAILANGTFLIAVQSSLELEDFWLRQFKPEKYHASIAHESIEKTVALIKSCGVPVRAILPGSEPGVLLAEELQSHFEDVPRNVNSAEMRRHKHAMHQRLREVGIRGIAEICTSDVSAAISWISDNTQFPVIVKPPMSGGGEGLHFCHTREDVREAFEEEFNKRNVTGVLNTELLVQEFLDGPEYVVDCVSFEGKHVPIAMWKYKKHRCAKTKAITYEYSEFLDSRGPKQQELFAYTSTVLDALGIRFGASHSEVIIDSRGPCLVETGARMHGGLGAKGTALATGIPPYDLLVDISVNGGRVFNEFYQQNKYIMKSHVLYVDLRNFKYEGPLARSIEEALRKFRTIKEMKVAQPGDVMHLTRDLISSPGSLLLAHADKEILFGELQRIRDLEDSTLYETCC